MFTLIRTDANDKDFKFLVEVLDSYLAKIDGEEHAFYNQLNQVDSLSQVVVAYENGKPIACGAMRSFGENTAEVKRMFTLPEARSRGVGGKILRELELWANELKFQRCVLETGKRQPDAIHLYIKHGYKRVPNFGKYDGVANSVCFEKELNVN